MKYFLSQQIATKILTILVAMLASSPICAQNPKSMGTGFFINDEGYLVTNHHVISGGKFFIATDAAKNIHELSLVASDEANDIAILKSKKIPKAYIPIGRSDLVNLGDSVFTLGFPNVEMQGQSVKYTDGVVSSTRGVRDQPNNFQVTVPVQPGNSGGPLVSTSGFVVGIIVAKLSASVTFRRVGALPENVNYAVKSNYLIELLRSSRINFKEGFLNSADKANRSSIIQRLEPSVVFINVYDEIKSDVKPPPLPVIPPPKVEAQPTIQPIAPQPKDERPPPKVVEVPLIKKDEPIIVSQSPVLSLPKMDILITEEARRWNRQSEESVRNKNWIEAIRTASAAIRTSTNYVDAYLNRCLAFMEYGDLISAKNDCAHALKIEPSHAAARNTIAAIDVRSGNPNTALDIYKKNCLNGFQLSCDNFKSIRGYAPNKIEEYIKSKLDESFKKLNNKDYSSVIKISTEILEIVENTPGAYINRSAAHARMGNLTEGMLDAERAVALDPNDPRGYNNIGYISELTKNIPKAILNYEIACGLKFELGCSNVKELKKVN